MAKVRIKDVAKYAGVSTATVSHVINQTRFVRTETRDRVLQAIEELNYQPSAIARGLATNATQTIGLVISDITNPFFTAVARGVEDEINRHGYHTIFCNTDEGAAREDEYLRLLSARQIDGLLIAPTGVYSPRLTRMAEAGLPIVLLDRTAPDIQAPLISVANESGAYQATQYLISLGHQRIGLLLGSKVISTFHDRLNGYKRALAQANIPFDESLVVQADPRFHNTQPSSNGSGPMTSENILPNVDEALHQLLDLPEQPSAMFITNNQMTLGMLYALKKRGIHCPENLSIISFDDEDWASIFSPPLTVVRQPTYHLGQAAAQLLMRMIQNDVVEPPQPFSVELVIRESCRQI